MADKWWDPFTWFTGTFRDWQQAAENWFSSTAGDIASGIEGGAVAVFGDLWDVIVGPLEIVIGVIIVIILFSWMFAHTDIAQAATQLIRIA